MTAVAADFAEMIEKFAPLSGPSGDTLADPGPRAS
jgi:hypothetical protein